MFYYTFRCEFQAMKIKSEGKAGSIEMKAEIWDWQKD